MAALKNVKTVGAPFSNASEIVRVIYDFAVDGGIETAKDVLIADGPVVIKSFYMYVLEACVGSGATLDVGISGGDTDVLATGIEVDNLTALSFHKPTLPVTSVVTVVLSEGAPNVVDSADSVNTASPALPFLMVDGAKIAMETNTAAFTAGKIELVFEICQA